MANVIVGEQTYTELPSERNYDPKRGWSTIRRFKGQSTSLQTLETTLRIQGYTTRLIEGPLHELQATIGQEVGGGGGDPIPDSEFSSMWELQGSTGEMEIARCTLVDAISAHDRKLLRSLSKGTRSFESVDDDNFEGASDGPAVTLFKLMYDGMTSVRIHYPTLRHIQTASTDFVFPDETEGVGEIYSTANLIRSWDIPVSVANSMVQSSSASRNSLTFWYGWMYHYPTISITLGNKQQRTKEWEWGLWPASATPGDMPYLYNA
jgi:hypothetical protein